MKIKGYCSSFFLTGILLVSFVCLSTSTTFGQEKTGEFKVEGKIRYAPLLSDNSNQIHLISTISASYGLHAEISYEIRRIGIHSGIGYDVMTFAQKGRDSLEVSIPESWKVKMTYNAWQIPLKFSWSINDRFRFFTGINILALQWSQYSNSSSTFSREDVASKLNIISSDNTPQWQFSQELLLGTSYSLSEKFNLHLTFAHSLTEVRGQTQVYSLEINEEIQAPLTEEFNFNWFRACIELGYKF